MIQASNQSGFLLSVFTKVSTAVLYVASQGKLHLSSIVPTVWSWRASLMAFANCVCSSGMDVLATLMRGQHYQILRPNSPWNIIVNRNHTIIMMLVLIENYTHIIVPFPLIPIYISQLFHR